MSDTKLGKAFEYACVLALNHQLETSQPVSITDNSALKTAYQHFELAGSKQQDLMDAAYAAVRVITRLEPQLVYPDNNIPLYITIQTDGAGIAGDVRDILCVRSQNGWQIGLSCKHNHHAVKHSRLSGILDFGQEWLGYPCSMEYFDKIKPLFNELKAIRQSAREQNTKAYWRDIPDKSQRYYIPLLQVFICELQRIATEHNDVPQKLVQYLMGKHDFYKVITDDNRRTTRIEAVNIAGTLNRAAAIHKSITDVPQLKMPTRFYDIHFKDNSDNTVIVACDNGWEISLRIHNASSEVESSLKFDVQLISLPNSIYAQVEPWDY